MKTLIVAIMAGAGSVYLVRALDKAKEIAKARSDQGDNWVIPNSQQEKMLKDQWSY